MGIKRVELSKIDHESQIIDSNLIDWKYKLTGTTNDGIHWKLTFFTFFKNFDNFFFEAKIHFFLIEKNKTKIKLMWGYNLHQNSERTSFQLQF